MKEFGIIGGGIAGLSLGYFLGPESEVLEKEDVCGGLCRSYERSGFTYDLGGHIIFSKDKEILDLELSMLDGQVNKLYRRASSWFKGRLVKYPFENGLGVLDKEDIFDCLYNFLVNPQRPQNTFEDWIYNTFGKGLAEQYLIPYNTKIWKTDPKEMDVQWVERIPKPPAEDVIKSAIGIETEGYTHQLYFYYPKTGGFQSLPRAFENKIGEQVIRNFPVKAIRSNGKSWIVSNGKEDRAYKRIVCAMPIFDFIEALEDVPSQVKNAINNLRYNSLIVVLVGINKPRKHDQVCVYFPQPEILTHRLVFSDYFGSNYVPEGCSSMVAEITAKEGDDIWRMSDTSIAARVVEDLEKEGFLSKKDVVVTDVKRTKYAYVIYDLERQRNLSIIQSFCSEKDIQLCGRFAEFEYYNSDGVIRSARTVADRLLK